MLNYVSELMEEESVVTGLEQFVLLYVTLVIYC